MRGDLLPSAFVVNRIRMGGPKDMGIVSDPFKQIAGLILLDSEWTNKAANPFGF
jgi:hypothetical protein